MVVSIGQIDLPDGGPAEIQSSPDRPLSPIRAHGCGMLKVDERIAIPLDEFQFDYVRSSGPGGQNVNKVASKAVLRWKPGASPSLPPAVRERLIALLGRRLTNEGEWIVTSQLTRDQSRNAEDCLAKVRALVLVAAHPPRPRKATRPTRASKLRRITQKRQRSETKRLRQKPDPG
ncbi:alternative ribosome rescue aminoacyl-tRNA hydrolase ArfB [soil metagenome]